jgi:transketolase C-terminal domain/subunit
MRARELAKDLVVDNIGTAVRQCFMTKPLDEPAIGKAVRFKHRRVVVGANISAIGSMGDALARTLQRHGLQPACLIPRIADAT